VLIAIQIARNHSLIDASSGQAPRLESVSIWMLPGWLSLVSAGWLDSEEKLDVARLAFFGECRLAG
jgi:hypothetical protein